MAILSFKRIEKKYMLNQMQYERFLEAVKGKLEIDEYGLHTICNIYCDTEDDLLITRSMEKPKYKEKMRVRSYGIANEGSKVFLEIKKKHKGTVYKRRVDMSLEDFNEYMSSGKNPHGMDSQIMSEIDYFISFYHPVPKIFVAYDRIAMFGVEDKEVRLTIDKNIRARYDDLDLAKGDAGKKLLPQGFYIMEIKVPMAIPLWLVRVLEELEIYPVSFSKVGEAYRHQKIDGYEFAGLERRATLGQLAAKEDYVNKTVPVRETALPAYVAV